MNKEANSQTVSNDVRAAWPGDWGALSSAWQSVVDRSDWLAPYDSRRIFHGRGHCYPGMEGVCLDLYDGVLLLTLYKEPDWASLQDLLVWLKGSLVLTSCNALLLQKRYLAGAPIEHYVIEKPNNVEEYFARRGNLRFKLNFEQQNVGYFLDIEPGRLWLETRAAGKRVLNLFSYTCAFSVVAVAAGAESVCNIDMSKRALNTGRQNHRLNGLTTSSVTFHALDILKSWGRIVREGPFDLIIIDPPSAQKGSFQAERDYIKIVRRLVHFARPGAEVLACLNAPHLDSAFIESLFAAEAREFVLLGRLPQHPDFPDSMQEASLKLMHYKYDR